MPNINFTVDDLVPTTEVVMATWRELHGGMAVGTRRLTAYPEWVTLEVAEGGFATGRALANRADGEESSTDFMAKGGIATLEGMLSSGRYRIDQPENAALLVLVWLLQQGRSEEASALFTEIAPYIDELRFYPHATTEPSSVGTSNVAAVYNVGVMRSALETLKRRNEAFEADSSVSYRRNQQRRQRAVAEGYAELQGDAIELLLSTVPHREAFLKLDPANPAGVEVAGKLLLSSLEGRGDDGTGKNFEESVAAIISRADELVERYGAVASHQRPSSTTAIVISALLPSGGVALSAANRCAVARRILGVARARGVKGTDTFAKYFARTAVSAIPEQHTSAKADAILARVARLPVEATIRKEEADIVLKPLTLAELNTTSCTSSSPLPLPPSIVRIVRRTVADTLESLIKNKVIVSAEMISSVLPGLLSAAAGACIEDDAARILYAQLTVSFSKRRSLLLVNLEKQVRLEELPWARPILSLLTQTTDEDKQCDAIVREVVRCYFTYFPATVIPNKVVSALKDVMRKGVSSKANLMEELATDIFQNVFSPNFDAAAFVASKLMKDTVYSRYYDLDAVYKTLEADYPKILEEIRVLWEAKAALIAEKLAQNGGERINFYSKAAEEVQKIFDAYTAETGKIVHSRRELAPLTPRGSKLVDFLLEDCRNIAREEHVKAGGSKKDFEEISDAYHRLAQEAVVSYYTESGGKVLVNYEHHLPDYDWTEPPKTPREEAAEKAMDEIQAHYYKLAREERSPGHKIQQEIDSKCLLIGLAKQKMVDWQMPHEGKRYNTVQSGRTIEAAMVITTHNLAQLADVYGSKEGIAKDVDFGASVIKVWVYIVSTFVNPPMGDRRAILHARRDVAYAWRQILCFISLRFDGVDAQREVLERMRAVVEARARKVRPEAAEKLETHFLTPLEAVIGGAVRKVLGDMNVSEGAIVLGYFGWRSFGGGKPRAERENSSSDEELEEEMEKTEKDEEGGGWGVGSKEEEDNEE